MLIKALTASMFYCFYKATKLLYKTSRCSLSIILWICTLYFNCILIVLIWLSTSHKPNYFKKTHQQLDYYVWLQHIYEQLWFSTETRLVKVKHFNTCVSGHVLFWRRQPEVLRFPHWFPCRGWLMITRSRTEFGAGTVKCVTMMLRGNQRRTWGHRGKDNCHSRHFYLPSWSF